MYLGLEIKQAEKLADIVLEKLKEGELSKEECKEYAILYSTINSEIEFEKAKADQTEEPQQCQKCAASVPESEEHPAE